MESRTWPYGTTKNVKVTMRQTGKHKGLSISVIIVFDEAEKESYILVGDRSGAKVGDVGVITFKEGGPTGGYWEFSPQVRP